MPSIRDFSGGVVNQELQNRDSGGGVLIDCKNVLSSFNGELRKRTGTRLLKELQGNSKLIPYRLPDGNDMLMILKDKVINCYKFDENGNLVPYVTEAGSQDANFPHSGWVSNTNGDWGVSSSSTYANDAYMAVNNNRHLFALNDFSSYNALYYTFYNDTPVTFFSCDIKWYNENPMNNYIIWVGLSPVIQYSDNGVDWVSISTQFTIPQYTQWRTESGWAYSFHTECRFSVSNNDYYGAHKYWKILFTQRRIEGNPYPTSKPGLYITNVNFRTAGTATELQLTNCPYENEDFDNIRWSQNDKTLTMTCKGKQPYQIITSSVGITDSLFTPSDYVNMWTANGFPACVTYYQNRLWFGGFELKPTRVYASAFGEFDKFTIPDPVVATSPIMADGTEISGIIENMWGGNNALYCLSEDGVSMIDAQGAIVAANQVEFKLRNREPVNSMVPTVKDDIMIYLGRDKRKILITDYDFVVQRFKANCISDTYNDHLQSGIKELHYIPRKSSLIYGVLENGKWFSLLFDLDKGKNALYPLETSGTIKDVQPIKVGDETKLVILTQLPSYQYIVEEKLPQSDQYIMDFMTTEEKEDYTRRVLNSENAYLDHSISRFMQSPANIIGGLPYLPDNKIEVIADGQYLGEHNVLTRENSELYAWVSDTQGTIYTDSNTPTTDSYVYDSDGSNKTDYVIQEVTYVSDAVLSIAVQHPKTFDFKAYVYTDGESQTLLYITNEMGRTVFDENNQAIGVATSYSETELVYNSVTYNRDYNFDKKGTINVVNIYTTSGTSINISRYYIELQEPANNIVMGYKYESYAVLKFVSPYNMRKFPKEISVNFINSGYMEVGNTFDSLKSVLNNLIEPVSINNKRILMNGNYTKTLDKQAFETPYVIVYSDKGLPFIITGIDYKVDMSNYQGGV